MCWIYDREKTTAHQNGEDIRLAVSNRWILVLSFPERNASLGEIVWGQLDSHFVSRDDTNVMLTHLA